MEEIRYIDSLILLIPIYSSCICSFFAAASLLFVHLKKFFFQYIYNHVCCWAIYQAGHTFPCSVMLSSQRNLFYIHALI